MEKYAYRQGNILRAVSPTDVSCMKKVFQSSNLPIVDYMWFYRSSFEEKKIEIIKEAEKIGYPMIVKPANLGSSVGISKANNLDELLFAIEVAMSYDRKMSGKSTVL